ncbi:MAG TPA: hotdog fold thioesterase [Steroidobacteraceae bacterium]|nr:hotdog fold thioesterase [Steroidobacteraceae bacterium]
MQPIWQPGITLDDLRGSLRATLGEHFGIELTELGADYLTGTMPVNVRTCQPSRLLHGGASAAFAETLGSLAANGAAGTATERWVGQELNANHVRPAPVGTVVTGTARPFHIGRRSQVWGIEILGEDSKLVCVARLTMAMVRAKQA